MRVIIPLFLVLKGLGGGYQFLFEKMGLGRYQGPLTGIFISALLIFVLSQLSRRVSFKEFTFQGATRSCIPLALLMMFVIVVYAEEIQKTPLNIQQSDMIPMTLAGLSDFTQGKNPYCSRILEGNHYQPGLYIPGIWLPYLPAFLLGIDIRWTNILPTLILFIIILLNMNSSGSATLRWQLFFLLITVSFSKVFRTQPASGHLVLLETTYPLFIWSVLHKRTQWTGWLLAFLINSREIACVLVFPFLLYSYWHRRELFRNWLIKFMVVTVVLNLPFIVWAGSAFFDQSREYQRTFVATHADQMLAHWGTLGILKEWGMAHWGGRLQLFGIFSVSLFANRIKEEAAIVWGAISWLWIILLMPTTWAYLFIQPTQPIVLLAAHKWNYQSKFNSSSNSSGRS